MPLRVIPTPVPEPMSTACDNDFDTGNSKPLSVRIDMSKLPVPTVNGIRGVNADIYVVTDPPDKAQDVNSPEMNVCEYVGCTKSIIGDLDAVQCFVCGCWYCDTCKQTGVETHTACSVCREGFELDEDLFHENCTCRNRRVVTLCDTCVIRGGGGMAAQQQ